MGLKGDRVETTRPESDTKPPESVFTTTLDKMVRPVKVAFFTQAIGCETCVEAGQILNELASASDSISIEELNPVLDHKNKTAETAVELICSAMGKSIL